MNYFAVEIVTPPAHLPVTVAAADEELASAVVEEIERTVLWRGVVAQTRRVLVDGPLPQILELEPVREIVSITRWTPTDDAVVIPATTFDFISRDPAGAKIFTTPGMNWPAPQRSIGSFSINYSCGWEVTPESAPGANDAVNEVPPSIQLLVNRAIAFRAGSGVGDLTIGSLKIGLAKSYKTDQIPREIASIGRAYAYRPGLFSARP